MSEYLERKELAMTGYGSFLGDLNIFKAQCFAIISNRISELRDDDMKKAKLKMKSKR